jgi:hypothetical protein
MIINSSLFVDNITEADSKTETVRYSARRPVGGWHQWTIIPVRYSGAISLIENQFLKCIVEGNLRVRY